MSTTINAPAGQTALLATFLVRGGLYALDAACVQEVIRLGSVTQVPYAPVEVLGIVNLRGRIVTIVDLGLRLGFPRAVIGPDSRVFIIEDRGEFIGLLIDCVDDVMEVERDQCQRPPANVNRAQARFFQGVCSTGGRVITVLHAGALLGEGGE